MLVVALTSSLIDSCLAQSGPIPRITDSESETLWTERFAHCDYGFYVLLPAGVVAHANKPPNPLHGFVIALPEVGTRQQVSIERARVIWVNAEYDASDSSSTKESAATYLHGVGEGAPSRKVIEWRSAKLGTLPATRIKVEYESARGKVVEEVVVAVRGNIVYEIGLRTAENRYREDKQQFEQIVKGFRVWRIHYC